jgi:hypothetical protein
MADADGIQVPATFLVEEVLHGTLDDHQGLPIEGHQRGCYVTILEGEHLFVGRPPIGFRSMIAAGREAAAADLLSPVARCVQR